MNHFRELKTISKITLIIEYFLSAKNKPRSTSKALKTLSPNH